MVLSLLSSPLLHLSHARPQSLLHHQTSSPPPLHLSLPPLRNHFLVLSTPPSLPATSTPLLLPSLPPPSPFPPLLPSVLPPLLLLSPSSPLSFLGQMPPPLLLLTLLPFLLSPPPILPLFPPPFLHHSPPCPPLPSSVPRSLRRRWSRMRVSAVHWWR
jgi:hypothetical protein